MYKNILIATDGSDFANVAVEEGVQLAKSLGSSITFITVTEIWSALDMAHRAKVGVTNPINEYETSEAEAAKMCLDLAGEVAGSNGINYESVHIIDMHPAEGIIKTAESKKCDLIVMASHGRRGLQKILLGSIASEVLTHSKKPVLIIKH
ncbi:MAG: universal stress protein [Gammaproteobacteria bacterium]|jgi:nucleotide-binding universal stress UspA family protein